MLSACSNYDLARIDQVSNPPITKNGLVPALAIRSPACIMCHAKIQGSLVTDLAYRSPYFLGMDNKANHPNRPNYGPFHSKHSFEGQSWKNASIMGDLIVPKVNITHPKILEAYNSHPENDYSNHLSIKDLFDKPLMFPTLDNGDVDTYIIPRNLASNQIGDITKPGLRGDVIEKDHIYIGAPTKTEIESLSLFPETKLVLADLGLSIYKGSRLSLIRGLDITENIDHRKYISHEPVLECIGDIIILDGILVLDNVTIKTNQEGCRIYATNTVFIKGEINFTSDSRSPSLQISSARAVLIGMRSGKIRLTLDHVPSVIQGVRDGSITSTEQAFNENILSDIDIVKEVLEEAGPYKVIHKNDEPSNIVASITNVDNVSIDVENGHNLANECGQLRWSSNLNYEYENCKTNWAGSFKRKTVHYKHVLFNAPKVYSRYYGSVTGSIIAEDALFAIGHFEFIEDPSLKTVPLLPLLKERVFSMKEQVLSEGENRE